MRCDAKIRPFPNTTELTCERAVHPVDQQHRAFIVGYAGPDSITELRWFEDDRRTFRGEWARCLRGPRCVLPAGHRGGHEQ